MNSSRESKKENLFLYAVRSIAALFVIVIHTRFPGKAGEILDALARFAVPFFFALSGRFLLELKDNNICTWYVMRNWLFVGIPFVLIGILFSDYVQGKKREKNNFLSSNLM